MKTLHGQVLEEIRQTELPVYYLRSKPIDLKDHHVELALECPTPDGALLMFEQLHLIGSGSPMCSAVAVEIDEEKDKGTLYYLSMAERFQCAFAYMEKPILAIFEEEESLQPPEWMELPYVVLDNEDEENMLELSEE